MSLVVNTNVTSLIAQRRLSVHSNALQKSLERLSSGFRINRASDDAAGLNISQNLISQIRRMQQASRNTLDGVSVLQTAEGALTVIGDTIQRVRELTIQAANDTNDAASRAAISNEIQSLLSDVDRIAASTNLNGIKLLDGTAIDAFIQVGPNSDVTTNVVDITSVLTDSTSTGLGIVGGTQTFANLAAINLVDSAASLAFLVDVDVALRTVNIQRANIGSFQNKLESANNNLLQGIESFSASNSRIRDVDVASETSNMVQAQILTQGASLVLSQTNELPRMILGLLQNK